MVLFNKRYYVAVAERCVGGCSRDWTQLIFAGGGLGEDRIAIVIAVIVTIIVVSELVHPLCRRLLGHCGNRKKESDGTNQIHQAFTPYA